MEDSFSGKCFPFSFFSPVSGRISPLCFGAERRMVTAVLWFTAGGQDWCLGLWVSQEALSRLAGSLSSADNVAAGKSRARYLKQLCGFGGSWHLHLKGRCCCLDVQTRAAFSRPLAIVHLKARGGDLRCNYGSGEECVKRAWRCQSTCLWGEGHVSRAAG